MMVSVSVVVVGGAGFIGSHLVDRLLADGQAVDVVDDLSSGSLANLSAARSVGGELKIHHLDAAASETGSLLAMRRPDVLYHLATVTSGSVSVDCHAAAFGRTLALLEAARQHGIPKIVVAVPATAIYGRPARARPADQGARARTARCAGCRGAIDRRPAGHLPRAARCRVHRLGDRRRCTDLGNVPTVGSSPRSPRRR